MVKIDEKAGELGQKIAHFVYSPPVVICILVGYIIWGAYTIYNNAPERGMAVGAVRATAR